MSRNDPEPGRIARPSLFCDLTQSWSEVGGGVRTYLLHKRRHILQATPHRHLLIVPGERDQIVEEDRAITVTIASPHVPGSPHYRLMLRNGAVRRALERFRPDLIECQDAYNLPWVAIAHRKRHPDTALVACYMTDFPTVYVERPFSKRLRGYVIPSAAPCTGASMLFWLSARMAGQPSSRISASAKSTWFLSAWKSETSNRRAAILSYAPNWASPTMNRSSSTSGGSTARRSRT